MDNNEQFKVESYISDSRLAFLVFHFLVKIISGNTLENWDGFGSKDESNQKKR